jgi:hypothetical protein
MSNLVIPEFNPSDPLQYIVDIDNLQKKIEEPKKKQILKYINSWMGKKNDDEKFKSFNSFRNIYLKQFPSDDVTNKFLCKYFEVYNQDFKLYITSKMANPHILPEITIKVTLIDFSVTKEGFFD